METGRRGLKSGNRGPKNLESGNRCPNNLESVNIGPKIWDMATPDSPPPPLVYDDDIVLLAVTPVDLQVQLDAINNWSMKWRLNINVTKTKIMQIDQIISFISATRILVTVTHIVTLVWSSMLRWIIYIVLTYCQTQAARALGYFKRYFKRYFKS